MIFVAWFEILVGVMIVALWISLLVTRQVPELAEGHRDIWFHVAAEVITAALLIAGGITVLVSSDSAAKLAAIAIGALLYTAVNSAGYYADRRQWPVVVMFALLAGLTAVGAVVLVARPSG